MRDRILLSALGATVISLLGAPQRTNQALARPIEAAESAVSLSSLPGHALSPDSAAPPLVSVADSPITWLCSFDFEGGLGQWSATDLSTPEFTWRWIDAACWSGHGNSVQAPLIEGGTVWIGYFEDAANAAGWVGGLGYGNNWCPRFESPELHYTGTGTVNLAFDYWIDTEAGWDYVSLLLVNDALGEVVLKYTGATPGFTGTSPQIPIPEHYSTTINQLQGLPVGAPFKIVFKFYSDAAASDQDGMNATPNGPFAVDNIMITGSIVEGSVFHTFDTDAEGFTVSPCPVPVGGLPSTSPLSDYSGISEPCGLAGAVLAFHNTSGLHPDGQHVMAVSPEIDLVGLGEIGVLVAECDVYSNLPHNDGVFWRPGWSYYDGSTWTGRVGNEIWYYAEPATCRVHSFCGGSPNIQKAKFILEVISDCDLFGIPPAICTGSSNFSPLFDNIGIGYYRPTLIPVPCAVGTIQAAINAAGVGDTVLVAPGTYTASNIRFYGKQVVVMSEAGPESTIINSASTSMDVFRFQDGELRAAELNGFTISGGAAGIKITAESSPTIVNCWLAGNTDGVVVESGAPLIADCSIVGSSAGGAGVRITGGTPVVEGSTVSGGASGINVTLAGDPTIENCTITGNTEGIVVESLGAAIRGCTIAGNALSGVWLVEVSEAGVVIEGSVIARNRNGVADSQDTPNAVTITGSTITDNELGYQCVGGSGAQIYGSVIIGNGALDMYVLDPSNTRVECSNVGPMVLSLCVDSVSCISTDPLFCSPDDLSSPIGDYTLQAASPCLPANNGCGLQMGALGQGCLVSYSAQTAIGSQVEVSLGPPEGPAVATLTFEEVTGEGGTTLVIEEEGSTAPSGFQIVPASPPTYYDISTTAIFNGSISVCLPYNQADVAGDEADLTLWHELPPWRDITSSLDTDANIICGNVTSFSCFAIMEPELTTAVETAVQPRALVLRPGFPNPFRQSTAISYDLPERAEVSLRVYDVAGRPVRVLLDSRVQGPGRYEVSWDGRDTHGVTMPSGMYFCHLRAGERAEIQQVVLLR